MGTSFNHFISLYHFSCDCQNSDRLARFCSNNLVGDLPHDIYAFKSSCLRIHHHLSGNKESKKHTGFSAYYNIIRDSQSVQFATKCKRYDWELCAYCVFMTNCSSFKCLITFSSAMKLNFPHINRNLKGDFCHF